MSHLYKLDESGQPVPCLDVHAWERWFRQSQEQRRVEGTSVGMFIVSTVFLGIDHGDGDGPPILFETMIFIAPSCESIGYQERYASREDAINGHQRAVAWAKENTPNGSQAQA